jgi:hypothetical protein
MHNVAINVKSKVFLPGAFFFVSFFFFSEVASVLWRFLFLLFDVFLDRWHFGGKWNPDGILEYSFKTDGILEVCRFLFVAEVAAVENAGGSENGLKSSVKVGLA